MSDLLMSSQLVQMLGALFAGVVSLAGVLVARGVRVSEFRQAWIDALRADLAALVAHVNAINEGRFANEQRAAKERARAATEPEATTAEDYEPDHADVVRIEEALAMIELRLNPKLGSRQGTTRSNLRSPTFDLLHRFSSQCDASSRFLAPGAWSTVHGTRRLPDRSPDRR